MDNLLYWLIEYGKVLLGYGFLMFVWPLAVFRGYLKNKSVTFKFSFCVTAQVVIINTVVLMMGLLHILNDWTLRIVFYGTFLYAIRECFALTKERKTKIKYLVHGSYGFKNFVWLECRKYVRKWENVWARFTAFYKKHWLEYSLLIVALVYGVIYFSWGVFHDKTYGLSDLYVHHEWIYELSEGTPFSSGIYPEGMHCLVYAINGLFGIKIYSIILYLSSINVALVLLSAYLLMKELFQWKYSAVFVLYFFLSFGDLGKEILRCFSRMQCTLPQEIAFSAIFLCALFLIRYLKEGKQVVYKDRKTKGYWDGNLLIFCLAFIGTIVIHFYATIMAFFLCVGIVFFMWKKVFVKERLWPLVCTIFFGVLVACMPMAAGYAMGIPLQGSLYWAVGVMQDSTVPEEDILQLPETNITIEGPMNNTAGEQEAGVSQGSSGENVQNVQNTLPFYKIIYKKIIEICERVIRFVRNTASIIYHRTYLSLYEPAFSAVILIVTGCVLVIGSIGAIVYCFIDRRKGYSVKRPVFSGYFIIIYISFIYILAFTSSWMGLPMLIDRERIGFILHLFVAMILFIPADLIFLLLSKCVPKIGTDAGSAIVSFSIVAYIYIFGHYHGYLFFEVTRYDSAVRLTNQITEELPQNSFTIISPTEELYQVIEYGRHEEILTFLRKQEDESIELPTEYVFVFVEKKPLKYAHYHFFTGPQWIACDRYQEVYGNYSTYPEYLTSEISEEYSYNELPYFYKQSDYYANLYSRTIIQSKMNFWCEKFKAVYPNEMKIYYEDDYVICYYWKQNVERLYNLVIE